MENGLFSSEEFAAWSKDRVLYIHIKTDLKDRKDEALFTKLGFTGFPTMAYLGTDAGLLAKHAGGRGSVEPLNETAAKAASYVELRTRAQAGDAEAKQMLFVADLGMNKHSFAEASLLFAAMGKDMPAPLREQVEQGLVDVQYKELTSAIYQEARESGDRSMVRAKISELNQSFYAAGLLPSGRYTSSVLGSVMRDAHKAKDAKLFSEALAEYQSHYGDNARYKRSIDRYKKMLSEISADK